MTKLSNLAQDWYDKANLPNTPRPYGRAKLRNGWMLTATSEKLHNVVDRVTDSGFVQLLLVNVSFRRPLTISFSIRADDGRVSWKEKPEGNWILPASDPDLSVYNEELKTRCFEVTSSGTETFVTTVYSNNRPSDSRSSCNLSNNTKVLRECILCLATEWESAHGGLSTFNRELCFALARVGLIVYCYVPSASQMEIASAAEKDVHLLLPANATGSTPDPSLLAERPPLPSNIIPTIIIGHDRHTGRFARAVSGHYPDAKLVQFIHTVPNDIEWFKPDARDPAQYAEDRTDEQVNICESASVVAGVGPTLTREIKQVLHCNSKFVGRIFEFCPGLFESLTGLSTSPPPKARCLVLGRMEHAGLKGIDICGKACSKVLKQLTRIELELVIRGTAPGTGNEIRKYLREIVQEPRLQITPKNYTSNTDKITQELMQSSVLLMPSRAEGFGLVGLEAISLAVPFLISSASGLANLLITKLPKDYHDWIIPVTDNIDNTIELWSNQLEVILSDTNQAFKRAQEIRTILSKQLSWESSALEVVSKALESNSPKNGR